MQGLHEALKNQSDARTIAEGMCISLELTELTCFAYKEYRLMV